MDEREQRLEDLTRKRQAETLTDEEYAELIILSDQAEVLAAHRHAIPHAEMIELMKKVRRCSTRLYEE